jgi:hypothetical protein
VVRAPEPPRHERDRDQARRQPAGVRAPGYGRACRLLLPIGRSEASTGPVPPIAPGGLDRPDDCRHAGAVHELQAGEVHQNRRSLSMRLREPFRKLRGAVRNIKPSSVSRTLPLATVSRMSNRRGRISLTFRPQPAGGRHQASFPPQTGGAGNVRVVAAGAEAAGRSTRSAGTADASAILSKMRQALQFRSSRQTAGPDASGGGTIRGSGQSALAVSARRSGEARVRCHAPTPIGRRMSRPGTARSRE